MFPFQRLSFLHSENIFGYIVRILVKNSIVPIIDIFKSLTLQKLIQPSPSTYPRIKCAINCFGTIFSSGNVIVKDFLGWHPHFISCVLKCLSVTVSLHLLKHFPPTITVDIFISFGDFIKFLNFSK